MSKLTELTIEEALEGLKNKELSAKDLARAHLDAMEEHRDLNSFITETPEIALQQADEADKRIAAGEAKLLDGIPIAVKDLFCTKGVHSQSCSHILDGFKPEYESSVTQKLFDNGGVMLGKTNMDEMANFVWGREISTISAPSFSSIFAPSFHSSEISSGIPAALYSLGIPIFLPLISCPIIEEKSGMSPGIEVESFGSCPAIACRSSALSFTVLPNVPAWSSELAKAIIPQREHLP